MSVLVASEITGKVSSLSMAGMTISALLLVVFPIFCILYIRNRLEADIREVVFGAIGYILIALLAVNVLSMLVYSIPGAAPFLQTHIPVLVLLNMLLTILPEIGLLALFFAKRSGKKQDLASYMEFAAGYVTVELVMVAATVTMTNLMIAGTYNQGGVAALMELTGAEEGADFSYLLDMMDTPFYVYLFSGIEGCLFAAIRIGFMVLMYMINNRGLSKQYYAVIIGLYALVRMPSALADLGAIPDAWIDPLLLLVCVAELIGLLRLIRGRIPEEVKPLFKKPDISFRRRKKAPPRSSDQGFH